MKRKPEKHDIEPLRRPNMEMLQAETEEETNDRILTLQQKAANQNILLPTRLNVGSASKKKDGGQKPESGKGEEALPPRIPPQA